MCQKRENTEASANRSTAMEQIPFQKRVSLKNHKLKLNFMCQKIKNTEASANHSTAMEQIPLEKRVSPKNQRSRGNFLSENTCIPDTATKPQGYGRIIMNKYALIYVSFLTFCFVLFCSFTIDGWVKCDRCNGTGRAGECRECAVTGAWGNFRCRAGEVRVDCSGCKGSGKVDGERKKNRLTGEYEKDSSGNYVYEKKNCDFCGGSGKNCTTCPSCDGTAKNKCPKCGGAKYVQE